MEREEKKARKAIREKNAKHKKDQKLKQEERQFKILKPKQNTTKENEKKRK